MGFFDKLKSAITKTTSVLAHEIQRIVTRSPRMTGSSVEELEAALLMADAGMPATDYILQNLKQKVKQTGSKQASEVKALLVGQSAEPAELERMRTFLTSQPEVAQLYNLLTQQLGNDIMVSIKARMHLTGSEEGLIHAINRVEKGFREAFPAVRWVFFEPDLAD